MPDRPKILAFAGSLREQSFNARILQAAAEGAAVADGDVRFLDLRRHPLPVFDQDLEPDRVPSDVHAIRDMMAAVDGFLIASPEYNASLTAALKNVIDWASRPLGGAAPLVAFRGKVAALCSASPGRLGGLRGLTHLRTILTTLGVLVLPDQVAVPQVNTLLDDHGRLADQPTRDRLAGLGKTLVGLARRMAN
jgi:NAD(P)H-dependent FMN reductase